MTRRSGLIGAFALAACAETKTSVPPKSATSASLPADATSEWEIEALLAPIDARALQLPGFTATYRVQAGDSEQTIRFAYLAPGRARLDIRAGADVYTSRVADGVLACGREATGPSEVTRFDTKGIDARWADCDAALDAAFPVEDAGNALPVRFASGPILEFEVHPESEGSEQGFFNASVSWLDERPYFLGWLGPKAWDHAHFLDEQRLEVSLGSTKATLSVATGMIQEMTFGAGFRATLVQFSKSAAASEFELPDATADSKMSSQGSMATLEKEAFASQRDFVYRRILPAASAQGVASDEFRHRAEPVFAALYVAFTKQRYRAWLKNYTDQIDQYFGKNEAAFTAALADPAQRESVMKHLDNWRSSIARHLESARDEFAANLLIKGGTAADEETRWTLWNLERATATAAFQSEVLQPVLLRADDKLNAIRESR